MDIKRKDKDGERYMGTAKIGPKGQIVIPKEVRDMFGLSPGDSVVILADSNKGIAIERMSVFSKIADSILEGRDAPSDAKGDSQGEKIFAANIKKLENEEK